MVFWSAAPSTTDEPCCVAEDDRHVPWNETAYMIDLSSRGGTYFFAALIFFVFVPILISGSASQGPGFKARGALLSSFLAVSLFGLRSPVSSPRPTACRWAARAGVGQG